MKLTNIHGLPEGLVRALQSDPYSRGDSHISVTQLINPPQLEALRLEHDDEISEDVSERIWMLLGQAAHVIAARGLKGDDIQGEVRLSTEVAGWHVSGAFDHHDLDCGLVSDYKVTSAWTLVYGDRLKDWEAQLNLYAELLRRNGYSPLALEVIAILRDFSERDSKRVKNYPERSVVTVPLEMWQPDRAEAYLEERVRMHKAARLGGIIPCTEEETWNGKRCEKYCPVGKTTNFCPQWTEIRDRKF